MVYYIYQGVKNYYSLRLVVLFDVYNKILNNV